MLLPVRFFSIYNTADLGCLRTFSSGITSVQCLYAPEFVSHTGGEKITVK